MQGDKGCQCPLCEGCKMYLRDLLPTRSCTVTVVILLIYTLLPLAVLWNLALDSSGCSVGSFVPCRINHSSCFLGQCSTSHIYTQRPKGRNTRGAKFSRRSRLSSASLKTTGATLCVWSCSLPLQLAYLWREHTVSVQPGSRQPVPETLAGQKGGQQKSLSQGLQPPLRLDHD